MPNQGGWHWCRSMVVHCLYICQWHWRRLAVVHCLYTSVSRCITSLVVTCRSFAGGTDHISQLSILLWKTVQKMLTSFYYSHDDSSEPYISTGSETVDFRPPNQVGKQTCRESANTNERSRFNQAWVKMLIAMEGPKLEDTESSAVICQACTEFCSRHERQKFK